MTAVNQQHLQAIYAQCDDPWGFRSSAYEQAKFRATVNVLSRQIYASALELGCGNGELARHVAPRCDAYTGLDAVGSALASAKRAVPGGRFVQAYLPCVLPEGQYDLIMLSEVLYFLDQAGLRSLGQQIVRRWPEAEIIAVTWLGPSGNPMEGEAALTAFSDAVTPTLRPTMLARSLQYRIDRFAAS